jgi:ribosomal protein S27AE
MMDEETAFCPACGSIMIQEGILDDWICTECGYIGQPDNLTM